MGDDAGNYVNKYDSQGNFVARIANQFPPAASCSASPSPCFGEVDGLATDSAGNLYVSAGGKFGRIVKFDRSGNYATEFGRCFPDNTGNTCASLLYSSGIAINGSTLYVLDIGQVVELTTAGSFVAYVGSGTQGSGPGQFNGPTGVAFDAAGDMYVADGGNNRVEKFSPSGAFLLQWGSYGTGPGQFSNGMASLAVDPMGNLDVVDQGGGRVEVLDQTGTFLGQFGMPQPVNTNPPPGLLAAPWGIAISQAGGQTRAYVSNNINNFVDVFQSVPSSPAPGPPPPPVLAKSVNVQPVSGSVLVKLPASTALAALGPLFAAGASQGKGTGFVPLTQARQIPVGSILDTTRGIVALTSATTTAGKTQSGQFQSGLFQILQHRTQQGLAMLRLTDTTHVCAKAGKASAARRKLSSRVLDLLRANVHGRFQTQGRYSATTVRGTQWETIDRCDGTLTRVQRGVVVVRDLRLKKNITLRAGKSYLAKAQ